MEIIGIDISEKRIRAAMPVRDSIQIFTLIYEKELDFGNPAEIAERLFHLQRAIVQKQKIIIEEAVASVPLYLPISDWARIKETALLLGIEIKRILPNITAAAFHAADKDPREGKVILCHGSYKGRFALGLYLVDQRVCEVLCLRNSCPKEKFKQFFSEHTSQLDQLKVSDIYKVVNVGEGRQEKSFNENILSAVLKTKNKRRKCVKSRDYPVLWALLQGAILNGRIKDMLLLDVTPWGYGISATGEHGIAFCRGCGLRFEESRKRCFKCRKNLAYMKAMFIEKTGPKKYAPLIERNQTIPTKKSDLLLSSNEIRSVPVEVIDENGKSILTRRFRLPIGKRRKKEVLYELTVDMDANQDAIFIMKTLPKGPESVRSILPSKIISETEKEAILRLQKRFRGPAPEIRLKYARSFFWKTWPTEKVGEILSDEEVDALLRGVDDEEITPLPKGKEGKRKARPAKRDRRSGTVLPQELVDALLRGASDEGEMDLEKKRKRKTKLSKKEMQAALDELWAAALPA